ncbi:MAG TPA: phosphonate ABC transporter ATP-binding protein [Planctomycetota bacterium]|nr:phosphonate ABC transporter ATP-binding protein [Planctomycetota bacterium]
MTTPTRNVLIEARDLTVTFGGVVQALKSVTLPVQKGELTVLLGRSGAGKSTLLRCLNRLQVPSRGSVVTADFGDLADARAAELHRRATGMVFQHHHLHGRRSTLQNVLTGRLGYHSTLRSFFPLPEHDVRLAMECLDRVGMADLAGRRADGLSGGEKQRVGIARALAQQPRLILADEPVASLDPATAAPLLERIRAICREDGLTAVLSLHQLDYAREFGERLVGMNGGRIVFDGGPEAMGDDDFDRIYGAPGELHHGLKENKT